jgi:hypothetical protein
MRLTPLQSLVNDLPPHELAVLVERHPQADHVLALLLGGMTSTEIAALLDRAYAACGKSKTLARTRTAITVALSRRAGAISGPRVRARI